MKDKLEKVGHKKAYYRFCRLGKTFAFAAILALGSALPIILVANASTSSTAAETASVRTSVDLDVDSSEVESETSYSAD